MGFRQGELLVYKAMIERVGIQSQAMVAENLRKTWLQAEPTYQERDFLDLDIELQGIIQEMKRAIDD